MSRFLELNDAAKILGVTPEALTEMRQRGEIHGYRDGASWKFKPEEVQRVQEERASGNPADSQYDMDFDHLMPGPPMDEEASSELDSVSILVSDDSLPTPTTPTSNKVIGAAADKAGDSDIKLADDSLLLSGKSGGSDLGLADESSELQLAGDSGVLSAAEAQPKSTDAGGTGDLQLASDEAASLGVEELKLDDELDLADDGALALSEDSDDLVLGGSGVGSDVSLDVGGSGINISKPSDSGLSLEEPLELGGSQIESLELPEDEEVVSLVEAADPDQATMLKQDEEFALSPLADLGAEDSSDSGSQVIALEDSDAFDQNAATMLGAADAGAADVALLAPAADMGAPLQGFTPQGGMGAAQMMAPSGPQPQQFAPAAPPEAPYSIFNVLGLLAVFMVMGLTGALMVDVLRNMWAFDQNATLSTGIMDMIIDALKM
ncbi:MAG: helix-turn-helix domain-containing protein [Pirellulales bacterium]